MKRDTRVHECIGTDKLTGLNFTCSLILFHSLPSFSPFLNQHSLIRALQGGRWLSFVSLSIKIGFTVTLNSFPPPPIPPSLLLSTLLLLLASAHSYKTLQT